MILTKGRVTQIGVIVAFVIIWEIIGRNTNPLVLVPPSSVAIAIFELSIRGELIPRLAYTYTNIFLGYTIGAVVGIPSGIAMGRWRIVRITANPFVLALYGIPSLTLVPLFILWVGIGILMHLTVIILFVLFIVLINTMDGVRSVNLNFVETLRSFGGSERQLLTKVILPGSLPYIMTGLRLGLGRAVVAAVVVEMFFGGIGLGGGLHVFGNIFWTAAVIALILIIGATNLGLTNLIKFLEQRWILRWRYTITAFD